MGGRDKGLQPFRGQPMAAWAIERLAPQVDALLINANQNLEAYAAFGHPVVPDRIAGFAGPLAGLHAGLLGLRDAAAGHRALRFALPARRPGGAPARRAGGGRRRPRRGEDRRRSRIRYSPWCGARRSTA
jgi:hypothetical protein